MQDDIRQYARLGLCHHMLYPRGTDDFDYQVETLAALIERTDIETFDCFMPYGAERRAKLIPLIRQCGKVNITFAVHLFPFRRISFTEPAASLQGLIRVVLDDTIEQVAAAGGNGLIFPSGPPSPENATEAHYEAFADFCRWLCQRCRDTALPPCWNRSTPTSTSGFSTDRPNNACGSSNRSGPK